MATKKKSVKRVSAKTKGRKIAYKNTAQRKAASERARAAIQNNRLVTVPLKLAHNVNGIIYGPGNTKVPNALAQELLNREVHAARVEAEFHGTRGLIIGPGRGGIHTLKQVPIETFDNDLINQIPADTVSGKQYK